MCNVSFHSLIYIHSFNKSALNTCLVTGPGLGIKSKESEFILVLNSHSSDKLLILFPSRIKNQMPKRRRLIYVMMSCNYYQGNHENTNQDFYIKFIVHYYKLKATTSSNINESTRENNNIMMMR